MTKMQNAWQSFVLLVDVKNISFAMYGESVSSYKYHVHFALLLEKYHRLEKTYLKHR